jgi:gamma-tubulin complex component 3
MDPEMANLQYVHPSSLPGQTSTDVGFGSIGADMDDLSTDRDPRSKLWEAKYQFQKEMLPSFVGEAFGKKVRIISLGEIASNRPC